ncbi:MAG: hypothetical protein SPI53_04940 [Erysipelotrichaceae bacterium]|nr:hypothetical protein [Erysipelotrichaceae bacterium]
MYALKLVQNEREHFVGVFENIDNIKNFITTIPGYSLQKVEDFEYEYLNVRKLENYHELKYQNHIVPLTKFSFDEDQEIMIIYDEVTNLDDGKKGVASGVSLVDAYVVDNNFLKEYIEKREQNYQAIKTYLNEMGYEVSRNYYGSIDGEAINYKKNDDWHFLTHMDPPFVEEELKTTEAIKKYLETLMN